MRSLWPLTFDYWAVAFSRPKCVCKVRDTLTCDNSHFRDTRTWYHVNMCGSSILTEIMTVNTTNWMFISNLKEAVALLKLKCSGSGWEDGHHRQGRTCGCDAMNAKLKKGHTPISWWMSMPVLMWRKQKHEISAVESMLLPASYMRRHRSVWAENLLLQTQDSFWTSYLKMVSTSWIIFHIWPVGSLKQHTAVNSDQGTILITCWKCRISIQTRFRLLSVLARCDDTQ